jgi:hypothetical protein
VKFKNVNKVFTILIYHKLSKVPSYDTWGYQSPPLFKAKTCAQMVIAMKIKVHMDACFTLMPACLIEVMRQVRKVSVPRWETTAYV